MRSIRERLNAMQPEPSSAPTLDHKGVPVESVASGLERNTDRGTHFVVETTLPNPTDGIDDLQIQLPSFIGTEHSKHLSIENVLFLDTETTGLDRGTGTHVFLVGIGYFSEGRFTVQQHFLRDLHEEPSMLCDLDSLVREFGLLVTFNGRGFDWPMISTRFILHGYRDIPELPHWDLLTSSRRVWRNRLRDCSLGSLERQILGVQRYGDVPGYLIPDLYFQYLRTRDARPLKPVFSHNQEDIVSLARLAECLLRTEQDPAGELRHPVDQLSYGLYLLNQGDFERAESLIQPNLHSPVVDIDLRFRGFKTLADHYKRRARWPDAIALWNEMLECRLHSADMTLHPLIELAKIYEHRVRDYSHAIRYVERALNLTTLFDCEADREALMHRYARLLRRLQNQQRKRPTEPAAEISGGLDD